MGVATTTDTTDSVRTSFGRPQNLYGMSVQVLAEKKTTFLFKKESFKNGQTFKWRISPFLFLKEKLFELYCIFTVAFIKYKKLLTHY